MEKCTARFEEFQRCRHKFTSLPGERNRNIEDIDSMKAFDISKLKVAHMSQEFQDKINNKFLLLHEEYSI